jgi:hypothetical protein
MKLKQLYKEKNNENYLTAWVPARPKSRLPKNNKGSGIIYIGYSLKEK